ncbi:MAG TPA: gamma-glutamyl-gamma-aminobutyrate hydrolase family protein [Thermoanaerobaculia bacterium]
MKKPLIGIGCDVAVNPGERDRSFVYMTYVEALRRAGAVPILIPPQPENAAEALAGLDGLLLAGGHDCDPELYGEACHPTVEKMDRRRQDNDVALAKAARECGIPTLGICLGLQVMNVAAGGTLVQHIEGTLIQHASQPENRARHGVIVKEQTQLAAIIGDGEHNVNSSHHQAVRKVGEGLRITAEAPDGIVEGLEDPHLPFYVGVQWHPEDMTGEHCASTLFSAFLDAARKHREAAAEVPVEAAAGNR